MSYVLSYTIPNTFDPSVSGLAASTGVVVGTVNTQKAWMKWGTGLTQWSPLHPVSATFGSAVTSWDTSSLVANLACDTLGGFKLLIQGTVNAVTNLSLRVNAASPTAQQAYWLGTNGFFNGVFTASLVGISLLAGPFVLAVECLAWKSGNNLQLFRAESAFTNAGSPPEVFSTLISRTNLPLNEIASVGLVATTTGALDAICQATITRI